MSDTRRHVHDLVDHANAPVESEPISDDEAAELDEAHQSIAHGEGVPHEDIRREFGLK
jgi:hypothetical protein